MSRVQEQASSAVPSLPLLSLNACSTDSSAPAYSVYLSLRLSLFVTHKPLLRAKLRIALVLSS